jgi:hypothetical protein
MIRRFPRLPIRRFPRLDPADRLRSFSMGRVYETLYKIAQGRHVPTEDELLVCRWFGLREMTRKEAKKLWRKNGQKSKSMGTEG